MDSECFWNKSHDNVFRNALLIIHPDGKHWIHAAVNCKLFFFFPKYFIIRTNAVCCVALNFSKKICWCQQNADTAKYFKQSRLNIQLKGHFIWNPLKSFSQKTQNVNLSIEKIYLMNIYRTNNLTQPHTMKA